MREPTSGPLRSKALTISAVMLNCCACLQLLDHLVGAGE